MLTKIQEQLERQDHRIQILRSRADGLNINRTEAEVIMLSILGDTWRFQVPLLDYIVDFIEPELGLAVEIDGVYHDQLTTKDRNRHYHLYAELGIRTVRFWSREVIENSGEVAERIRAFIQAPPIPEPPAEPELERKRQRADELKWIKDRVRDFEMVNLGKTRAEILQIQLPEHPEVRDRIHSLILYWPEQGYVAPGLQTVTLLKKNR